MVFKAIRSKPEKWRYFKREKRPAKESVLKKLPGEDYDYAAYRRTLRRVARQTLILTGKGLKTIAAAAWGLARSLRRPKRKINARFIVGNRKTLADIKIGIKLKKNQHQ
ncbi:MAG: hypothetical protein J6023_05935 [Clostridia bacterium]|nr:hypothetical protein [Clostridia bacterium]